MFRNIYINKHTHSLRKQLYTLGNNNLSQLGIGKQMQMTLQPMLVKAFDGKNITILEAGQYHNAVVADGMLYTWG